VLTLILQYVSDYDSHLVDIYEVSTDIVDCSELERRPLTDEEIARLYCNLRLLMDHVDVSILVYDLYVNGCITS